MIRLTPTLRGGVEWVSRIPWAFDALRWLLEGGYRAHRKLLARHFVRSTERVLDCGCGTGTFASNFAPQSYVGVDICSAYILHARTRYPQHRFQLMDATQLAFASNSFDAAIVCGMIHHLDAGDTQRVLSELARVIRPGGQLLLWEDVPARHRLNVVGHCVHHLDVGSHIRSSAEYAQLLMPYFQIESMEELRSGFMDYAVFSARKPARRDLGSHFGEELTLVLSTDQQLHPTGLLAQEPVP